jgi:CRP-like cAMP-binding protein
MQRARFGSMVGDLGFMLRQKRAFGAVAEKDTCLFALSRAKFIEMERNEPFLAMGLMKMLGRSLGMTLLTLQQLTNDV